MRTIPERAVCVVALRDAADVVAPRDTVRWVVLRDMFARDALGDTVPRDTVVRTGVIVRLVTLRDGVCIVLFRVVVRDVIPDCVPRGAEFAVRTAASVTPMHVKNTARKDSTFLILSYIYNDIKKA